MKIYGITSKYNNMKGKWTHFAFIFESEEIARKWLNTETGNFAEREIFQSREEAEVLCGKKVIENAYYYDNEGYCYEITEDGAKAYHHGLYLV